jgi:hypothetical protein
VRGLISAAQPESIPSTRISAGHQTTVSPPWPMTRFKHKSPALPLPKRRVIREWPSGADVTTRVEQPDADRVGIPVGVNDSGKVETSLGSAECLMHRRPEHGLSTSQRLLFALGNGKVAQVAAPKRRRAGKAERRPYAGSAPWGASATVSFLPGAMRRLEIGPAALPPCRPAAGVGLRAVPRGTCAQRPDLRG